MREKLLWGLPAVFGLLVLAVVSTAQAAITITTVPSPQNAVVGQQLRITVQAGTDTARNINLNLANAPTGATLTAGPQANPRSATFTFTPTAAQVGSFPNVTITASETGQNGASAQTVFTIVVGSANQPPVLDPIPDQAVGEGELLEFTVSGSDPDGDALTFSASNLPAGASFDAPTRTFSWTPDYDQSGDYPNVLFTVTSGTPPQSDSQNVRITVGNVNRTPALTPIGSQTATENEPLTFQVTGTDPDGDSLAFAAGNLPEGASFDPADQTFTWTPDYDQAGTYTALFTVTDDGEPPLSASEEVTITVGNVNRPPVLDPIGDKKAFKGVELSIVVTGNDPDGTEPPYGNVLTYSASGLPEGASFDPMTQTFTWTPVQGQEGDHAVTFEVADDGDPSLTDSEVVTITVANLPPVADAGLDQTVEQTSPAGAQVTLDGSASSDPDGDDLTYAWSWSGGSASGKSPTVNLPAGTTTVTLTVDDGIESDTDTVDITVRDTIPPTITFLSRSPAANSHGWNNGDVTVTWTCADSGSGATTATVSVTVSTEGAEQSVTGTCEDAAGNESSDTLGGVNIDKTPPSITWNGGPADGETYYFGFVPAAPTCTAADALSGPNGCGVTGWSDAIGSHTMSATTTDKAGNSQVETRSYRVSAWTLSGFYQPVDMNGVYNTVKNGSTVPLKFEIFAGSTEVSDVAQVMSLAATTVTCVAGLPEDPIDITATGGTALRYDTTAGQFVYNWKTPNTAGKCYRVTMTTKDGSALMAYFKLR